MLYSALYEFILKVRVKEHNCIGVIQQRKLESHAAGINDRKKNLDF